ncbi:MAG: DUF3459 domain-containing protein, partial [Pseudomonadota bacterium]|nr:DUF3459 domain-containing protein [Pseudomonadota bacterium]
SFDLVDGAVLASEAFVLRYVTADASDLEERLLLVNLGLDLVAPSLAEPLVAPPDGCMWTLEWSSEAVEYGGAGTPDITHEGWRIPGHAAFVLRPVRLPDNRDAEGVTP